MSLQTIFATNRNIDDTNGNFGYGDEINGNPEELKLSFHTMTLQKDKRKPVTQMGPPEPIEEVCAQVLGTDNGKPWVFFCHGNNQTTRKNLYKAARIQELYDVNLVVFSWPSRSYNDAMFRTALKGMIGSGLSLLSVAVTLGTMARRKAKQYKAARRYADLSDGHLAKAIELLSLHLFSQLPAERHTCFLVHSLGNLLFRNMVETHRSLSLGDFRFKRCVLHQADAIARETQEWIGRIPLTETHNITVTQNNKDIVLFGARVLCALPGGMPANKRAGTRVNPKHRLNMVQYLDFTGSADVGYKHGVAWQQKPGSYVFNIMRPLLTGR